MPKWLWVIVVLLIVDAWLISSVVPLLPIAVIVLFFIVRKIVRAQQGQRRDRRYE